MDSNVLIDYTSRKFTGSSEQKLDSIFDDHFCYSIISHMEVLGYNAPEDVLQNMQEFLSAGVLYYITAEVSNRTILIRRSLAKIKLPDAIIAATALAYGNTLLTRNIHDFKI